MEGMKPVAGMVLVQLVFASVNILYKLALNDGMDGRILVAYRYLFAAAFLCPLAFFMERQVVVIGSALIVVGLYAVLWGKSREAAKVEEPPPELIDVVVDAGNATGYQEKKPSAQTGNVQT
ncbi:hypothetical protein B296_00044650 [Ensete ventricosum]|uniref:WAT1-related protein n=1 Tax=Ensete ventricosum TaxID=4639 RepID=A0A426X8F1_ENSVE|nr:hypothetical protein B296_00044650 [Ensete ventricosum]